jgi:tetratricopeptide (TPR) repeat protein
MQRPAQSGPDPRQVLSQAQHAHGAGDYATAARLYTLVAPHYQKNFEFLLALGECRLNSGNPKLGAESVRKAIRLRPDEPRGHALLARALLTANDTAGAQRAVDKAIELAPDDPVTIQVRCDLLAAEGANREAFELLRERIRQGDDNLGLAIEFARFAAALKDPDEATALLKPRADDSALSDAQRTTVNFRLGALFDAAARYDDAWEAYARANALRAAHLDVESWWKRFEFIERLWTPELVASLARSSVDSQLPVLIVGMPRSGTTLIEQTIAAHPAAAGGGERRTLNDMIARIMSPPRAQTPQQHLRMLTTSELNATANAALRDLQGVDPAAARVTDKMPLNLQHLGMVWMCLPGAKVIWSRRDPRDTCLSCFFHGFTGGHPYAYDLESLARQTQTNDRLMARWKRVLDTPILDVQYEDFVADPEAAARRIIDFVGLPWDDACLRPHEAKRAVVTASAQQVREPVYSSAVGRWKRYEKHLGPLLEALDKKA